MKSVYKQISILISVSFYLTQVFAQERGVVLLKQSELSGKTYALIIGISDYKNISKLNYADKDGMAFEQFLRSKTGGNIPNERIYSFYNAAANKINIANALSEISKKLVPGDKFYFFFAGHGDMEVINQTDNGLLLLHDSPKDGYFGIIDDVVEVNQLRKYLNPYSEKGVEIFYIVDACHSGKLSGGDEGRKQTAAALLSVWGKEYKILSCQPNQLSYEEAKWGGGRGIFSLKLEEGIKGKADSNKDGIITMYELYLFTLAEVTRETNFKQIPLINGDLSKPFSVKSITDSAETIQVKVSKYIFEDSSETVRRFSPTILKWYNKFDSLIKRGDLIMPYTENAVSMYRKFIQTNSDKQTIFFIQKQLIAALSKRFNVIVSPLLQGERSVSSKYECRLSARELDTCLSILGEQHYLYSNFKARKLYMDAMSLTWALNEEEYNFGLKNTVEAAIDSLEKSYELEPNAAYTSLALGERYAILANTINAEKYFNIYLSLRPNGVWAQYSLGKVYAKMGQYSKAENLFSKVLQQNPNYYYVITDLSDMQLFQNKFNEAKKTLNRTLAFGDTAYYYSCLGLMYGKSNKPDSAIYFYKAAKNVYKVEFDAQIDNNIGHMYWVKRQYDSAKYYFNSVLKINPKNPFSNFNLGSVEFLQNNYEAATSFFIKSINGNDEKTICFVNHQNMYFNKTYTITNPKEFKSYSDKLYIYKIRYFSYLNIFYAQLRVGTKKTEIYNVLFDELFKFKEFDAYTNYHYACYRASENDINGALDSIEKALKAGFGNYFLLSSDDDLIQLRTNSRYIALLKKYFPDK
jgi:tetratricopeptide (TPR) repeat protein